MAVSRTRQPICGGSARLVRTVVADPLLYLAVPPKAVVGLAVLLRGAFRPDAALAPSFTLAAFGEDVLLRSRLRVDFLRLHGDDVALDDASVFVGRRLRVDDGRRWALDVDNLAGHHLAGHHLAGHHLGHDPFPPL